MTSIPTSQPLSSLRQEVLPAFVVGVTGHMDIAESDYEAVKARLRSVLEWLRAPGERDCEGVSAANGAPLKGLGLQRTPIIVLTSLAPGADSLIAQVAIELGATTKLPDDNTPAFRVRVPLPFSREVYPQATTFRPPGASQATIQRNVDTLEALLAQVSEDDVFLVLTKDDWSADSLAVMPSRDDLLLRCRRDVLDQDQRHRRYRAAGEYIAAYSDLLVAVWDGREDGQSDSGTAAIVKCKLEGFTPDLLAVTTDFRWANTGPVLHVRLDSRVGAPRNGAARPVDSLKSEGLLFPAGTRKGETVFCARTKCLDRFHLEFNARPESKKGEGDELKRLLGTTEVPGRDDPEVMARRQALEPLARLRWRASFLAGICDGERQTVMRRLCWLIVVAAVMLHLYAHWRPEVARPPVWLEPMFLASAIVSSLVAVLMYWLYQRVKTEARRYDYRALCEGVRVQFHWNRAGVGRSVAAHYMQRQRGEMDWIRSALASVSFPYQRSADTFQRLALAEQVKELRAVAKAWVLGQHDFFQARSRRARSSQDLFHALGWGSALAGLLHLLLLGWWLSGATPAVWAAPVVAVSLPSLLCYAWFRWRGGVSTVPLEKSVSAVPLENAAPTDPLQKRDEAWRQVMFHLFPQSAVAQVAALILAATAPLPFGLAKIPGPVPGMDDLWIIVLGIVLTAGAVFIAWSEKSLFAEHARQYESMEGLFDAAHQQLQEDLRAIEQTMSGNPPEARTRIARVQSLLFSLGKEALDEHAEWLILHRARPLEPFVTG